MNQKNKQQGQQNKGFTLLEVLIAMTILAIIVVPLLQAFVTSAGVNAKARRTMNATSVAENVIEELKAESLEAAAKQFNGYAAGGFTQMCSGTMREVLKTVAADGSESYTAAKQTGWETNALLDQASVKGVADAANPEGVFTGQTSNEYHFQMTEVKMGSSTFDVALHLTPNSHGTSQLATVYDMDDASCGFYVEDESLSVKASEEFQLRNAIYAYDAIAQKDSEAFSQMMSREITIKVNQIPIEGGKTYETVDVTYTYTIPTGYTTESDRTYTETIKIFDNSSSEEELEAIFLYNYPMFTTGSNNIVIENDNNLKVDVYLIEMEATGAVNEKNPILNCQESNVRILTNMWNENGTPNNTADDVPEFSPNVLCTIEKGISNEQTRVSVYDIVVEIYTHADTLTDAFKADDLLETYEGTFTDNSLAE